MFAQSLKLNASRHVLAWRQVHLSAVVAYCVHYQTSHGSACRGVCVYVWVCVRVGEREGKIQTCLSLTVVFSVIAPHPQVFSPDLWRTVNSSRAVSLSPPLSLAHPHVIFLRCSRTKPRLLRQPRDVSRWKRLWLTPSEGYTSSEAPREAAVPPSLKRNTSTLIFMRLKMVSSGLVLYI